jgi:molybdopterin converting factor small subunit
MNPTQTAEKSRSRKPAQATAAMATAATAVAATATAATDWVLTRLNPAPEDEWERLREFLGLGQADIQAMLATVEALFRRGYELVVGNYDYLLKNHETAAILGWESGADPEHLAERRRFFTVWLARTLGMDLSHDFARYLFRSGQYHAGHGPRRIHVPEVYVTGAISLVNATFARFLNEDMPGSSVVPAALAGWNKALSLHLHMMLLGYRSAVELDQGDFPLRVALFGRMREFLGCDEFSLNLPKGETVETALRKMFNYYPQVRDKVFDIAWQQGERVDSLGTPWMTVEKGYRIKYGWRLLVNGKDIAYGQGIETPLNAGDELHVFPPGR